MPKRPPVSASSAVVLVRLPKEVLSLLESTPISSLTLKPGKENTASAAAGSSNEQPTKLPNWREVGSYVDSLTEAPHNLTAEELSRDLIYQNKDPLRTPLRYRICNICDRPVLELVIALHITECLGKKNEPVAPPASKTPPLVATSPVPKKKRRVDKEKEKEEARQLRELKKQQKLEERKQKKLQKKEKEKELKELKKLQKQMAKLKGTTKSKKGPVDVERQCGVPLKDGGFCARSLTCKTHSMGAKRAVPGRSALYDALLAAYQRKNQVKLLASSALAQAEKDDLAHGGSQFLDLDEETAQVMEGVGRSFAMPLSTGVRIPVSLRNKYVRMREFYSNGFGNGRFSSHPISGRVEFFKLDNNDEYVIKPRAFNTMAQQQQILQQQKLMQKKMA